MMTARQFSRVFTFFRIFLCTRTHRPPSSLFRCGSYSCCTLPDKRRRWSKKRECTHARNKRNEPPETMEWTPRPNRRKTEADNPRVFKTAQNPKLDWWWWKLNAAGTRKRRLRICVCCARCDQTKQRWVVVEVWINKTDKTAAAKRHFWRFDLMGG